MTDISQETVPEQPREPTWEEDESSTTLALRAASTLLVGALLAWAQYVAPASWSTSGIGANWNSWIELSVVANFLIPLFVVWMFFGQGLSHLDWLKDQRHNAWNYGWNFAGWHKHLLKAFIVVAVMLPFVYHFSRDPDVRQYYQDFYFPPLDTPRAMLYLLGTLTIYMFCWEWFFRGFLLFGMAQGFGIVPACLLQAVLFGLCHLGKATPETVGAFIGGGLLGIWAWRERSFLPAFFTHALLHIAWAILIYH